MLLKLCYENFLAQVYREQRTLCNESREAIASSDKAILKQIEVLRSYSAFKLNIETIQSSRIVSAIQSRDEIALCLFLLWMAQ